MIVLKEFGEYDARPDRAMLPKAFKGGFGFMGPPPTSPGPRFNRLRGMGAHPRPARLAAQAVEDKVESLGLRKFDQSGRLELT